jgi:hypothetical protein
MRRDFSFSGDDENVPKSTNCLDILLILDENFEKFEKISVKH